MKLTSAQKRMIERLQRAKKIGRGVSWYVTYLTKDGSFRGHLVDSKVCDALERKGILQPTGNDNEYKIVSLPDA
jgi:hypothetical protein